MSSSVGLHGWLGRPVIVRHRTDDEWQIQPEDYEESGQIEE